MKVNELIKQLQKLPGDMDILTNCYEGGDFHLEGFYRKPTKDGYDNYAQGDIDYFITYELKNDRYVDKKIVIVENDDD